MTFALTLPEYERNLSTELSAFQQNGDLVDMTVAADGHLVRVHRLLLASVSPYLKELITSTTCTQPVLFLNNMSYSTLCSLLEYIYTGEVQVSIENITDVLNAGKALHIKGLEDMNVHQNNDITTLQNVKGNSYEDAFLNHQTRNVDYDNDDFVESSFGNDLQSASDHEDGRNSSIRDPDLQVGVVLSAAESGVRAGRRPDKGLTTLRPAAHLDGQPAAPSMQYTLSNRGSLQMILNRYMYYVKYCSKRSGFRQWRCVDYIDHRCPATVVTKDDAVLKRIAVHNHPYHDKRILKKTQVGAVFSTLIEAEDEGQSKKKKTETTRQKQGKDQEMET